MRNNMLQENRKRKNRKQNMSDSIQGDRAAAKDLGNEQAGHQNTTKTVSVNEVLR